MVYDESGRIQTGSDAAANRHRAVWWFVGVRGAAGVCLFVLNMTALKQSGNNFLFS